MQVNVTSLDEQHLQITTRDVSLTVDRFARPGTPSDGFLATELLLGSLGA